MIKHTVPIHTIVIHCTATPAGRKTSIEDVRRWHRKRGWDDVGYHYLVRLDGSVEKGRPDTVQGAHAKSHNDGTLGVAYVGGVTADDKRAARDTRTPAQKHALRLLIATLRTTHQRPATPPLDVIGHRDLDAGKACPSFDAHSEYGAGAVITMTDPLKPLSQSKSVNGGVAGLMGTVTAGGGVLASIGQLSDLAQTIIIVGLLVGAAGTAYALRDRWLMRVRGER